MESIRRASGPTEGLMDLIEAATIRGVRFEIVFHPGYVTLLLTAPMCTDSISFSTQELALLKYPQVVVVRILSLLRQFPAR